MVPLERSEKEPQNSTAETPTSPQSTRKPSNQRFLKYAGLAFQMGFTIFLGAFAGRKLDNYFELKTPYLTALFALLGVILAIYTLYKDISRAH
ncbi:MAG: AtpZ/AtpI family protein [Bacteroidota bacterium]